MARKPGIPKLHKHAGSGLAVVRLNGKDHYCGPWGSEQAEARYHRCVAEWLSAGVPLAIDSKIDTVGELVLMFFNHCQTYYVRDGKPTDEVNCQKAALRFAAQLYADLPDCPWRYARTSAKLLTGQRLFQSCPFEPHHIINKAIHSTPFEIQEYLNNL